MRNTRTSALYKLFSKYIDYDPDEGTFYRKKVPGKYGGSPGQINPAHFTTVVEGKQYQLSRVAWTLKMGTEPTGPVFSKDGNRINYKWDNIKERGRPKRPGRKTTTKREKVNGQVMEVDHSPSKQPRTPANEMRMAGKCKGCKHYINRCLENNMVLSCLGREGEEKRFERSTISSGGKLNALTIPRY